MNVLYGMLERSDGEVELRGRPVRYSTPREAIADGIGMVHQHFKLAGAMTVAENISLLMDRKALRRFRARSRWASSASCGR
jgi:simple sugar transport system ATP-binding protein